MKISNFLLLPILFLTLSCSNQKEQITFGFAGDRVDGIPGAPGIGTKTATTLLEKFWFCGESIRQFRKTT